MEIRGQTCKLHARHKTPLHATCDYDFEEAGGDLLWLIWRGSDRNPTILPVLIEHRGLQLVRVHRNLYCALSSPFLFSPPTNCTRWWIVSEPRTSRSPFLSQPSRVEGGGNGGGGEAQHATCLLHAPLEITLYATCYMRLRGQSTVSSKQGMTRTGLAINF